MTIEARPYGADARPAERRSCVSASGRSRTGCSCSRRSRSRRLHARRAVRPARGAARGLDRFAYVVDLSGVKRPDARVREKLRHRVDRIARAWRTSAVVVGGNAVIRAVAKLAAFAIGFRSFTIHVSSRRSGGGVSPCSPMTPALAETGAPAHRRDRHRQVLDHRRRHRRRGDPSVQRDPRRPADAPRGSRSTRSSATRRCSTSCATRSACATNFSRSPRTSCGRRSRRWGCRSTAVARCCTSCVSGSAGGNLSHRLELTRRQVDRLAALVATLVDVSRITSGKLELSKQHADLVEVIRTVAERLGDDAQRSGSSLRIEGERPGVGRLRRLARRPGAHQPGVQRDPLRTRPADHGRRRRQSTATRASGSKISGIGIPPEHQTRIFQQFERAAPSTSYGGLGLGLWISRQIVDAMGGTISVRSQVDVGSVFTVELPRDT